MGLFSYIRSWLFDSAKIRIADIVEVLKEIDANGDGEITVRELVNLVRRMV